MDSAVSCIEDACLSAVTITSSMPPLSSSVYEKKGVMAIDIKKTIFFMKPPQKFHQITSPKYF